MDEASIAQRFGFSSDIVPPEEETDQGASQGGDNEEEEDFSDVTAMSMQRRSQDSGQVPHSADSGDQQQLLLPIANVERIIRLSLGESNTKLSREFKEGIQECVTEFIAFVASEAGELCDSSHRQTLQGDDGIAALSSLGFDSMAAYLGIYLRRYKELREHERLMIQANAVSESTAGPAF